MQIKEVNVSEIKEYAKNAKKHSEDQVKAIANSIKKFGFRQPIVLDAGMEIIIGHGRFEAAKSIGMTEVPCVMADDLTEEQVKALRIADNKTNESEWDFGLLGEELSQLVDIDMTEFGFNEAEILELEIDDSPEEIPAHVPPALSFENVGTAYVPQYEPEYGGGYAGMQSQGTGNGFPVSDTITRDELNHYSQQAEQMVTRRVIVVYSTEEEEAYLKDLLAQDADKPLGVVLDVKHIMKKKEEKDAETEE